MDENPLSPELRQRLAGMRQHVQPLPEGLEDRVVERLRREGAFARFRFGMRWLAIASAAAVLFVAGFFAGRVGAKASAPEFNYVLLLQEGVSYQRASQDVETRRRVAEYREWASTLRSHGVDISGLKLQERADSFGKANSTSFVELAGLFMVKARDMEEARHIAETCPHIRYGGGIVIRPIEKT
jgi:hypothetical protein